MSLLAKVPLPEQKRCPGSLRNWGKLFEEKTDDPEIPAESSGEDDALFFVGELCGNAELHYLDDESKYHGRR